MLALPSGGGQVIARLPQYSPGPGVIFGGNLTLEGVMTGLRHALCAVVVLLVLGVAGQVVSSRGWLSLARAVLGDRKSTRLNSSHTMISYAVFCLKKKIHDDQN